MAKFQLNIIYIYIYIYISLWFYLSKKFSCFHKRLCLQLISCLSSKYKDMYFLPKYIIVSNSTSSLCSCKCPFAQRCQNFAVGTGNGLALLSNVYYPILCGLNWTCVACGLVLNPTSIVYYIELGYISYCQKSQLQLY